MSPASRDSTPRSEKDNWHLQNPSAAYHPFPKPEPKMPHTKLIQIPAYAEVDVVATVLAIESAPEAPCFDRCS